MALPRNALGKGLGALIPAPRFGPHFGSFSDDWLHAPVGDVRPDPDQPRQHFDEAALEELTQSIREKGILQPLIVRRTEDGHLLLVAGERRLRAALRAGLETVPVVVKDVASDEALELALIENLQREDLNAIEEARAYERLLAAPAMTQETLARRLGKDRSTIANALRLLRLEPDLQQAVVDGRLSAGHARALLTLSDPASRSTLAARVASEGLSVRQAEDLARTARRDQEPAVPRPRKESPLQPYLDGLARDLSAALGAPVEIKLRGRKGQLVVPFHGLDDLRRLRDRLAT